MITLESWNKSTLSSISVNEKRTDSGIEKSYTIEGCYKTKTFSDIDDIKKIKQLIKEAKEINTRVFSEISEIKKEAETYNIDFEECLKDHLVAIDSYVAYYMIDYAEENYHELLSNCAV